MFIVGCEEETQVKILQIRSQLQRKKALRLHYKVEDWLINSERVPTLTTSLEKTKEKNGKKKKKKVFSFNSKNFAIELLEHFTLGLCFQVEAPCYSLMLGMKVVILVKIEIPFLHILIKGQLKATKWTKKHHELLFSIDEKRLDAIYHDNVINNG